MDRKTSLATAMPTREFLFFFRPFLATPCAISQQSPCGYSPYYVSRELLQSEAFGIKSPPPPLPKHAAKLSSHPNVFDRESCPQAHQSSPKKRYSGTHTSLIERVALKPTDPIQDYWRCSIVPKRDLSSSTCAHDRATHTRQLPTYSNRRSWVHQMCQ